MKKKLTGILCVCLSVILLSACGTQTPDIKDDFYEAVNAEWLDSAEIPSDRPSAGGFDDLSTGVEETLMSDFDAMLNGEKEPGSSELSNFIEFYRLAVDFEARDGAGAEPIIPYMEKIENLSNVKALDSQLAEWDLAVLPLPFSFSVMADMGDASMNALYIAPPSLFLLDKSYYEDEATKEYLYNAFTEMTVNLLVLAGKTEDEATAITEQAMLFDESLAPYMKSAEESSDYTKLYNPVEFQEFDRKTDAFDFSAALKALIGEEPEEVILTNPEYFDALDDLVNEESFSNMKSWMLVYMINIYAPCLSEEFRLEAGSFGRLVMGVSEAEDQRKSAYYLAQTMFSEVVGVYYGKTYFGEEAKQDAHDMVQTLIDTFEARLSANTWLGEDTRANAIKKLQAIAINVGYPDKAASVYSKLQTVPAEEGGTFLSNDAEFMRIMKEDNYGKWNTPADRGEWPLSADTVNAMYSPLNNSINFPAAILQAPFYSLEQSASANYGGIGAVIAHEISHAFDPNGSKFDELGTLNDWWTEEDYAEFEARSQAMVEMFDGVSYAGGTVSGTLTVTENVADAGGLACALEAIKESEDADLEAFFTNWAVIWRQKATQEYEALLLTLDVHAPSKLRANMQLQNMDDFYTTFDIVEGDGMYLPPADRVNIW